MVMDTSATASTNPEAVDATHEGVNAPGLQVFVFALFFIFGGITSLNDVIIPKLKELFTLNYTQAMLVQFCFFTAYLVIGIPGAKLVKKIGYMRGAVAGLLTMMVGCLLFIPASKTRLTDFSCRSVRAGQRRGVGAGRCQSTDLVARQAGDGAQPPDFCASVQFARYNNLPNCRLNPDLGSLATVSAKELSGAELDAYRTAESQAIVNGYFGLAIALAVVAAVVWMFRNRLKGERHEASRGLPGFDLIKRTRFGFGSLCIFLYVGAEVSIGSLIVNYLMQPGVMGLGGSRG